MNKKVDDRKFKELYGEFLMTFGALETQLIDTILTITGLFGGINDQKTLFFQRFLEKNTFNRNFEILQELIKLYSPEKQENWNSFIADIKSLQTKRNQIYGHKYSLIREDGVQKKTKENKWEFTSLSELQNNCKLLNLRYKQLFDSTFYSMFEYEWTDELPILETKVVF